MTNRHQGHSPVRARFAHVGAALALGAIALTGCSGGNDEFAEFCDASEDLAALDYASLTPDQESLSAASTGDFTALNEWGVDAQATVEDVGATFQETLNVAPNEEIADALESYLAALDLIQQLAIVSADAEDFDESMGRFEELGNQMLDQQDDLTAADDIVIAAQAEHCN